MTLATKRKIVRLFLSGHSLENIEFRVATGHDLFIEAVLRSYMRGNFTLEKNRKNETKGK